MAKQLIFEGDVCYVPLTKGHFAIIDSCDAHLVSAVDWCALEKEYTVYANRADYSGGFRKTEYLHRRIVCAGPDDYVDHCDRNGLNNRRSNLRVCSNRQNQRNAKVRSDNTTGFKGVFRSNKTNRYRAMIRVDGKRLHLGVFHSAEEAYGAYCEASKRYHGEFGRTK